MKLHNPLKTHEIAGRSFQFGRLTIGIGIEIESYLKTIPPEIEQIESSGILKSVPPEVAGAIVSDALQRHDVWPPDAITAVCQKRNLLNASFCHVMVKAALRQYNPGLSPQDVEAIASQATHHDATKIALTLSGADDLDPKELAATAAQVAE